MPNNVVVNNACTACNGSKVFVLQNTKYINYFNCPCPCCYFKLRATTDAKTADEYMVKIYRQMHAVMAAGIHARNVAGNTDNQTLMGVVNALDVLIEAHKGVNIPDIQWSQLITSPNVLVKLLLSGCIYTPPAVLKQFKALTTSVGASEFNRHAVDTVRNRATLIWIAAGYPA